MKALHILNNLRGKMLFLPAVMVLLALTTSLAQAPANDVCANATPLTCGQTVTGSTLNATIDQTPTCNLVFPRYGVWYSFAGNNSRVTLTTCGGQTNYDTQIGVYSGSCAALTCVAGNNNDSGCAANGRFSTVTFPALSGTTYYILVTGVVDSRGLFTLSSSCAPINDNCADALTLSCGQTVTGSTAGATPDFASTITCTTTFTSAMRGVWFNFTPTASGNTTLSLCGSGYDTKLGVFTGSCAALNCVAGNDDFCGLQSQVSFNATAGTTYLVHVSGFGTATGNFTLTATCAAAPPPPPPVCTCTNTTAFGTASAPAFSGGATTISTCNFPSEYATINNAVAGTTYVFTSSVATDFLTVRQGTPSGTALGCGTTPLTVTATASGPLYLHISLNSTCDTQASGCRTTTVSCSSCPAPPTCANATPLACGGTVTGSTAGIPADPNVPLCTTALNTAGGRWHTLFVPNSGSVTVTTCAAVGFDTKLGVFSGTCSNLTCIAGNDDAACSFSGLRSTVTFTAVGGTTYLVYVTGFGTATGSYELSATCSTTTITNTGAGNLLGDALPLPEGNLTIGQVFPNPLVGNTASILVDSPKETEAMIRFMDQMGREVMLIESDLNRGENLLQLNISRLPAGTYFMMIQVEGKVIPRRLVVPRA